MIGAQAAALTALAVTALSACSGGQPPPVTGAAAASTTLRVGLLEWRIVTSSNAVLAGTNRITVTNTGTTAHDLRVLGTGVDAHTPDLEPGQSVTLRIRSRSGEGLTLTCQVSGHRESGMQTTVAVLGPPEPAS